MHFFFVLFFLYVAVLLRVVRDRWAFHQDAQKNLESAIFVILWQMCLSFLTFSWLEMDDIPPKKTYYWCYVLAFVWYVNTTS